MDGIAEAKDRGVKFGRKRELTARKNPLCPSNRFENAAARQETTATSLGNATTLRPNTINCANHVRIGSQPICRRRPIPILITGAGLARRKVGPIRDPPGVPKIKAGGDCRSWESHCVCKPSVPMHSRTSQRLQAS